MYFDVYLKQTITIGEDHQTRHPRSLRILFIEDTLQNPEKTAATDNKYNT